MTQEFAPKREALRRQQAAAYEEALADVWSRRAELRYEERALLEDGLELEVARRVLHRWRLWLWIVLAAVTPLFVLATANGVWILILVCASAYLHPLLGYLFARQTYKSLQAEVDVPSPAPGSPTNLDADGLRDACAELEDELDERVRFGDRELIRSGHSDLVREAMKRRAGMRFLLLLPVGLFFSYSILKDAREEPLQTLGGFGVALALFALHRQWELRRSQMPSQEH